MAPIRVLFVSSSPAAGRVRALNGWTRSRYTRRFPRRAALPFPWSLLPVLHPTPLLGAAALALCGLTAAPLLAPSWAPQVPWDVPAQRGRLDEDSVLSPRPIDPWARLAAARRASALQGDRTRSVGALLLSLSRWGRGHPRTCLEGAEIGWSMWRESGSATLLETADRLLREYLVRAPGAHTTGVTAWLRGGETSDPRRVFGALPPDATAAVAGQLLERDPAAAWALLEPILLDEARPWVEVEPALRQGIEVARRRRDPADARLLRRVAERAECPEDLRRGAAVLSPAGAGGS